LELVNFLVEPETPVDRVLPAQRTILVLVSEVFLFLDIQPSSGFNFEVSDRSCSVEHETNARPLNVREQQRKTLTNIRGVSEIQTDDASDGTIQYSTRLKQRSHRHRLYIKPICFVSAAFDLFRFRFISESVSL
jgi:hypothetical protein